MGATLLHSSLYMIVTLPLYTVRPQFVQLLCVVWGTSQQIYQVEVWGTN